MAFFSRTLSGSEKHQSVIEREACAIVEAIRRWNSLLHATPKPTIVTDQRSVSFLFGRCQASKIKSEKLARWRLELADLDYNIAYRPGPLNTAADALSRCCSVKDLGKLSTIHSQLCHPLCSRLFHYCKVHNLPFSVADVRHVISTCSVCKEVKPRFCKPPQGRLIHATRPWERVSIDFVGPLPSASPNKYLLVLVDEYSRYPFAFPCKDMSTDTVISHLLELFSMFGSPGSLHSDRGAQLESAKLRSFLVNNGTIKTRTTPYSPQGNGQCERTNGTIMKSIRLALRTLSMDKSQWEQVLPLALASIRSLLCTATNETPHDCFIKFNRHSIVGSPLPNFLRENNTTVLHRQHITQKGDLPVEKVILRETLSPHFARVEFSNGRVDTVSTRNLAPYATDNSTDNNNVIDSDQQPEDIESTTHR